jgi:endoglucanase
MRAMHRSRQPIRPTLRTLFVGAIVLAPWPVAGDEADSAPAFWSVQRRGANCQNERVTPEYWRAVRAARLDFVRLIPDGWPSEDRDFLIGNADAFDTLNVADLEVLRRVLDDAHAQGVRVVLTMFSLPGSRWRQNNGDRDDLRLWTHPEFRGQASEFWRQVARSLRGHPAVVAWNPLNEPHPERAFGLTGRDTAALSVAYETARGTPADLDAFNREMVAAIRSVDPTTPIMLEGGTYASPEGLTRLEPVADAAILYAFHDYGPRDYGTFRVNRGRFAYPERMPPDWRPGSAEQRLDRVAAWARRHEVGPSRIVVGEFGVDRRVAGAPRFLEDAVQRLEARGWHWAFYAFRPDGWSGLDYEMGTAPIGAAYWKAVESGTDAESFKRRGPNPLWDVLSRALASPRRVAAYGDRR